VKRKQSRVKKKATYKGVRAQSTGGERPAPERDKDNKEQRGERSTFLNFPKFASHFVKRRIQGGE